MDGYLLYDTPQMNCFPKTEEYVPNYIGSLPCSNLGDRVYYIYDENIFMILKIKRKMNWIGTNMIISILEGPWINQPK